MTELETEQSLNRSEALSSKKISRVCSIRLERIALLLTCDTEMQDVKCDSGRGHFRIVLFTFFVAVVVEITGVAAAKG